MSKAFTAGKCQLEVRNHTEVRVNPYGGRPFNIPREAIEQVLSELNERQENHARLQIEAEAQSAPEPEVVELKVVKKKKARFVTALVVPIWRIETGDVAIRRRKTNQVALGHLTCTTLDH